MSIFTNSFYTPLSFSEKFSVAFTWVRQNFKPLLKFSGILILPLCLLQAYGMIKTQEIQAMMTNANNLNSIDTGMVGIILLYVLSSLAASYLGYALFYSLFRLSVFGKRDLGTVTFGEVWHGMTQTFGRLLLWAILITVMAVIALTVFGLTCLVPFLPIVSFAALVVFFILLMGTMPSVMLTDDPVFSAIARGVRLTFKTFSGFLGTGFFMFIIAFSLIMLTAIPFYGLGMAEGLMKITTRGAAYEPSAALGVFTWLAATLYVFASSVIGMLYPLILNVQFGHAAALLDDTTDEDIPECWKPGAAAE